jgi:hypothetical protein
MDRQEGKEKENEGGNKEHKEGREKGPEQEQDHEHNVRKEKGRELTQEEQDEQDTWDKEQEDRKKTVDKACTEWKYLGVATVSFGQEGGTWCDIYVCSARGRSTGDPSSILQNTHYFTVVMPR